MINYMALSDVMTIQWVPPTRGIGLRWLRLGMFNHLACPSCSAISAKIPSVYAESGRRQNCQDESQCNQDQRADGTPCITLVHKRRIRGRNQCTLYMGCTVRKDIIIMALTLDVAPVSHAPYQMTILSSLFHTVNISCWNSFELFLTHIDCRWYNCFCPVCYLSECN